MCLIDYRGYRLTCISLIPIDKVRAARLLQERASAEGALQTTIIYGSCDGGHTVHADVEEMNELMQQAARKLNLKGHIVGDKAPILSLLLCSFFLYFCVPCASELTSVQLIYGPGDIEGHLGRDHRYYVVDCARYDPPPNPHCFP
jgi:hypothetical protein